MTAALSGKMPTIDVGDSEDEVFWKGFMTSLKQRGLAGVKLVISDQHSGLVPSGILVSRRSVGRRPGPVSAGRAPTTAWILLRDLG